MRHTQRNPQKSSADSVPDLEKIVKQRKTSQKGASRLGKPKQSYVSLQERLVVEQVHFEDIEPSNFSEEIILEIHRAPFSLSFPLDLSPKKTSHTVHHIPLSLSSIPQLPTFQTASILPPTPVMVGPQAPTKTERIIATSYGPLVLPVPLNAMPTGEFQKYMPKLTGTEGVIAEEHLEYFYSYADNLDISEDDVWMRVFV